MGKEKAISMNMSGGIMGCVLLFLWAAGALLLKYAVPQYDFPYYWAVPAMYFVFGVVFFLLMSGWERRIMKGEMPHAKLTNNYMVWKIAKMVLCLVGILLYRRFIGIQFTPFLITFFIFYLALLASESFVFMNFEKRYAIHRNSNAETAKPEQ